MPPASPPNRRSIADPRGDRGNGRRRPTWGGPVPWEAGALPVGSGEKGIQVVHARWLVAGVLSAGSLGAATAALAAPAAPAAAEERATSSPDASSLYQQALSTTRSWYVHYASSSTQSAKHAAESGDAGPASGSQTVLMGQGSISIVVIGGLSYVKGNAGGLQTWSASMRLRPPRRQASGSSSRPATLPSRRSWPASAPRTSHRSWRLKGPLTLGHSAHGRRAGGRRHQGDAEVRRSRRCTSSSTCARTARTSPWRRTQLTPRVGARRPSTSRTPSGASRCGPRPRWPRSPSVRSAPSEAQFRPRVTPAGRCPMPRPSSGMRD